MGRSFGEIPSPDRHAEPSFRTLPGAPAVDGEPPSRSGRSVPVGPGVGVLRLRSFFQGPAWPLTSTQESGYAWRSGVDLDRVDRHAEELLHCAWVAVLHDPASLCTQRAELLGAGNLGRRRLQRRSLRTGQAADAVGEQVDLSGRKSKGSLPAMGSPTTGRAGAMSRARRSGGKPCSTCPRRWPPAKKPWCRGRPGTRRRTSRSGRAPGR